MASAACSASAVTARFSIAAIAAASGDGHRERSILRLVTMAVHDDTEYPLQWLLLLLLLLQAPAHSQLKQ